MNQKEMIELFYNNWMNDETNDSQPVIKANREFDVLMRKYKGCILNESGINEIIDSNVGCCMKCQRQGFEAGVLIAATIMSNFFNAPAQKEGE